jgi:hypothetical protein
MVEPAKQREKRVVIAQLLQLFADFEKADDDFRPFARGGRCEYAFHTP